MKQVKRIWLPIFVVALIALSAVFLAKGIDLGYEKEAKAVITEEAPISIEAGEEAEPNKPYGRVMPGSPGPLPNSLDYKDVMAKATQYIGDLTDEDLSQKDNAVFYLLYTEGESYPPIYRIMFDIQKWDTSSSDIEGGKPLEYAYYCEIDLYSGALRSMYKTLPKQEHEGVPTVDGEPDDTYFDENPETVDNESLERSARAYIESMGFGIVKQSAVDGWQYIGDDVLVSCHILLESGEYYMVSILWPSQEITEVVEVEKGIPYFDDAGEYTYIK
ncbi:MAG: hypothetical protein ACOX3W_10555 [Christensenellaceae bacterium]